MIRKTFFWAHLISGVLASIVILIMSVTGVLLTYERQMIAWSAKAHFVPTEEQDTRLSLEELINIAKTKNAEFSPSSVVISKDPGAPVSLQAGRFSGLRLNPYTGEEMEGSSESLEGFFRSITGFHRWFNVTGENRAFAKSITGVSNLIFLFLILSGMYLWLPRLWKWGVFKARLLLNNKSPNSKARDFHWHHVFGIWSAIPLAIVVATACVFSYGWANNLVYQAFGEEAPVRRGPPGPPPAGGVPSGGTPFGGPTAQSSTLDQTTISPDIEEQYLNLDQLFVSAQNYVENEVGEWQQISLNIPGPSNSNAQFSIDMGNGGQPQLRHNLILSRETGELNNWQPFSTQSPGQRARLIIRFLHTGESLGILGQTIAGLVSLFSLLMVWTGLALSYRRLVKPLFKRKTN